MGAEPLVQVLVPSLHREVEVELPERGQERVRVAERIRDPVRILDLELVLERELRFRQQRLPEPARILQLRLHPGRLHAHGLRLGAIGADDDAAVVRLVRAEDAVGIRSELDHQALSAAVSMSLCIPAAGMRTQSGRLSSS